MGTNVLVIGKIAHRLIFNILSNFNELSQSDSDSSISRSGEARREFDGIALNIAYGLSILGASPTIVSLAGRDFDWYFQPYFNGIDLNQKVFIDLQEETELRAGEHGEALLIGIIVALGGATLTREIARTIRRWMEHREINKRTDAVRFYLENNAGNSEQLSFDELIEWCESA